MHYFFQNRQVSLTDPVQWLLKEMMLPKEMEDGQNYPPNKRGKENCNEASKYLPLVYKTSEGRYLRNCLSLEYCTSSTATMY